MAKLRSGTLPIEIEKGRYRGKPRNERYCKQCNINVVETEDHFLLHCPKNYIQILKFKQDVMQTLGLDSPPTLHIISNNVRCISLVSNHIRKLLSNRIKSNII